MDTIVGHVAGTAEVATQRIVAGAEGEILEVVGQGPGAGRHDRVRAFQCDFGQRVLVGQAASTIPVSRIHIVGIVAGAAYQRVVPGAAPKHIVAPKTVDRVVALVAGKHIVGGGATQRQATAAGK